MCAHIVELVTSNTDRRYAMKYKSYTMQINNISGVSLPA